ncbi:hypothetical protein J6590_069478 [Homalodisca vitripennis]|nr:hypothetical protein J6590_069478 [Homalodisca vitripennis]
MGKVRPKKFSLTLNLGTNGLKLTSEPSLFCCTYKIIKGHGLFQNKIPIKKEYLGARCIEPSTDVPEKYVGTGRQVDEEE